MQYINIFYKLHIYAYNIKTLYKMRKEILIQYILLNTSIIFIPFNLGIGEHFLMITYLLYIKIFSLKYIHISRE